MLKKKKKIFVLKHSPLNWRVFAMHSLQYNKKIKQKETQQKRSIHITRFFFI